MKRTTIRRLSPMPFPGAVIEFEWEDLGPQYNVISGERSYVTRFSVGGSRSVTSEYTGEDSTGRCRADSVAIRLLGLDPNTFDF